MTRHAGSAAKLLRALASRPRLMILCVLAEGEISVSELNRRVPLSQSALSQHLAVLRRDHLVSTRRQSQTIYYALRQGPALDVIETLHSIYCGPAVRQPRKGAQRGEGRQPRCKAEKQ
ncbi:MAG: metalloregulator ArsR/SmtB family transcription factor [Lysobacterales bacterium]